MSYKTWSSSHQKNDADKLRVMHKVIIEPVPMPEPSAVPPAADDRTSVLHASQDVARTEKNS